VKAFEQVCRLGGRRCDGALYWKAYALSKRNRKSEAQAAIAELRKAYPASRWLGEAKALELEIQQAAGRAPSPEQEDDEELKLLALDSLMNSDAERALPLLEEFLKSGNTPRLKDRALFVLSQSAAPRARGILLGIAQGATNPDLQRKAVKYLGMSGDAASLKALEEIYAAASEVAVKQAVLEAFIVAEDHKRVLAAARAEKSPELRREAVHALGALGAAAELQQLYGAEAAAELREEILNALVAADAAAELLDLARVEKDARLRATAVRNLGALDAEATGAALLSLYGNEKDGGVRRAVLEAFVAQDNCHALVQLGRGEKEPGLRRALVEHLSALDCKEATDFLLEILKK
jgi:HEAT repeat protein